MKDHLPAPESLRAAHCSGTPDKTRAPDEASDAERSGVGGVIYADGYCARCSGVSRPLTDALARCGVYTGADKWQQTWGVAKVLALDSYESALRRLLLALDSGKPEEIAKEKINAEFQFEFHTLQYRRMLARSQAEALEREVGGGGAEQVGGRDDAPERSDARSKSAAGELQPPPNNQK